MIDPEMLKTLGWSDELISAATEVSRRVDAAAVRSIVGSGADLPAMAAPRGSQSADVSGPPVASPQLHIEAK